MISAYSIFKSPTSLDKRQGFSGSSFWRFQGRVDYTLNLAQEINLSRIQRCFRQIRRLIKQAPPMVSHYAVLQSLPRGPLLNILGRLLSSEFLPKPGTEQGGCLYEQPNSQEDLWKLCQLEVNGNALSTGSIQYQIALHVMEAEDQQAITETGVRLCIFLGRNISFAIIVWVLEKSNWQKPGIGIAAVSPVPKREFRKGEGTDYPYLQDTVRGKAIAMGNNTGQTT